MSQDHRPPQPQKVLEDLFPDAKRMELVYPPRNPVASMSNDELERFALKARWAVSPVEDTNDDTKAAVAIGFVREILPQIMKRFCAMRHGSQFREGALEALDRIARILQVSLSEETGEFSDKTKFESAADALRYIRSAVGEVRRGYEVPSGD